MASLDTTIPNARPQIHDHGGYRDDAQVPAELAGRAAALHAHATPRAQLAVVRGGGCGCGGGDCVELSAELSAGVALVMAVAWGTHLFEAIRRARCVRQQT